MGLRLHNTLGQTVQALETVQNNSVGMYSCGPTVYDYVHIGNFRTFVFQDLLRRYIRYKGFHLTHVMNVTDVDDKIIQSARLAGLSIKDYTTRYAEAFFQDMEALRIQKPEIISYATDHIQDMVELIVKLRENGYTYESAGSNYYRIGRFSSYGKLSNLNLSEIPAEGRVDADEYTKENPRDFVLWKAKKPHEAYWESPLGAGRPGWHIECSAMSMKYLGATFDLHCGGVDLIFPHHENEIAQSEAATGKPFVRHWIHSAHLIVDGEKMSKSKGNFYTLRQLLDGGHSPSAIRYLLQSIHYRKQLNFTLEGLGQAQSGLQRIGDFLQRVREVPASRPENPDFREGIAQARIDFETGMDDDLNTSAGLAALFQVIREGNVYLERGEVGAANRDQVLRLFADANEIFGVFPLEEQKLQDREIAQLIQERSETRRSRNYQRADQIRDRLAALGVVLEDTKEGTRWKRAM